MALRRALTRRFLDLTQSPFAPPSRPLNLPPPTHLLQPSLPSDPTLQTRQIFQSAPSPAPASDHLPFPADEKLLDRLRLLNGDRLRFEGLSHPRSVLARSDVVKLSIAEARKVVQVHRLQLARERLRSVDQTCVSYAEFLDICEGCLPGPSSDEEAPRLAKTLEESGTVLVFGDAVFLQPELVVKAMEEMVAPLSSKGAALQDDSRRAELARLEEEKAEIDRRAEKLVKRELWAGLGFLVVQTAGFMRLTFWELSWDVMEPICFYVTSLYFMAGYAFFLRTSRDPSFEGFFDSRFAAKQRRLLRRRNFDVQRLDELRKAFGFPSDMDPSTYSTFTRSTCHQSTRSPVLG